MKTVTLVAVATAVLALPLAAQQPGGMPSGTMMRGHMMQGRGMQEMMPGMDSMMAPLMRVMAFTPEHLLKEKATLHLTAEQETALTALRDAARTAHDAAARQAVMHMREMEQVMETAAPDTAAAKTHFDAAHRFMGDPMWAMVRGAAQARAVLTDAQRKRVDDMAGSMMRMPGGGGM